MAAIFVYLYMPLKRDKEAIKPGPVERFQINWEHAYPPVDLYMNFENSSWKTQVQRTGFLACKNQY